MQQGALAGATGANDGHHLSSSDLESHPVKYGDEPSIAARVRLRQVDCFQHLHSCRIASTGNNFAACRAGYSVASAAITRLASTINATSSACVATGR